MEVEVESVLKTVKLELTRRKEPWCCGGGDWELLPDNWESSLGLFAGNWGLETSLVTSEETSLGVAGIEGVDKGVDSSAVGTIGNKVGIVVASWGTSGCKVGAIQVEGKVTVGGVMGVDEGVSVGVNLFGNIIVVIDLGLSLLLDLDGLGNLLNGLGNLNRLDLLGFIILSIESSSLLSVGWDVCSFKNPESVLSSAVSDIVGLAILADVRVLTDAVAVNVGLLTEDVSIFGGECGSSTAITGIESLLLQDLGILGVDLCAAGSDGNGQNNQTKHF